jgi:hypothetical protein
MKTLALEKIIKDAQILNENLIASTKKSQKILRLFDATVPPEDIFKEIQTEKYAEAKKLLQDGIEASDVSRRLGMSMSEVLLLSSYL